MTSWLSHADQAWMYFFGLLPSLCFLPYLHLHSAGPVCSLILLFSWPESSPFASLLILKFLRFASALSQRYPWFSTECRWSCCPWQCCRYLRLRQLHEDTLSLWSCDFSMQQHYRRNKSLKTPSGEVLRYAYAAWEIQINLFVLFLHFSLSNCCPLPLHQALQFLLEVCVNKSIFTMCEDHHHQFWYVCQLLGGICVR